MEKESWHTLLRKARAHVGLSSQWWWWWCVLGIKNTNNPGNVLVFKIRTYFLSIGKNFVGNVLWKNKRRSLSLTLQRLRQEFGVRIYHGIACTELTADIDFIFVLHNQYCCHLWVRNSKLKILELLSRQYGKVCIRSYHLEGGGLCER
jgi:hypothetical protein